MTKILNANSEASKVDAAVPMEFMTDYCSATVYVEPYADDIIEIEIRKQIFSRSDVAELISFLKLVKKSLPKEAKCVPA